MNRTHEVRGSIPLSSTETASIAEIACPRERTAWGVPRSDPVSDGRRIVSEQGFEMGRRSLLYVRAGAVANGS